MYIKNIRSRNFRALHSADIPLRPGLNILIGPNNVGKSTILSAIDLVLNHNLQWWRREILTELDFFRGGTDEPLEIELVIACGRPRCDDADNRCPRLEVVTEDKPEQCKLADWTVTWDNKKKKFLKMDEMESAEEPEGVVRLKMAANYQKTEGFVETNHWILNEDGNEWTSLTGPMKEWIGARLLASNRDPMAECRMQYNSLLSRAVGDTRAWRIRCTKEFRTTLGPIVKELAQTRATEIINLIDRTTKDIGRAHAEETVLSLGEVQSYDIIRQVELCRKGSEGQDEGRKEWEIPFSRQGRGLQNVASLVLGVQSGNASATGFSIILLEEPEQNLEPQMQRSSVKSVRNLCGTDAQIIMSTHSPYVLSSIMDLNGVQRLAKSGDGELSSVDMGAISAEGWDFFKLRRSLPHDMEVLEALFSPLVVMWEGDSEAGFYPALMRQSIDYPSEWLAGINTGGTPKGPCAWFKKAGYETVAVVDGDEPGILSELFAGGIAFLALPPGKKFEHIVAEALSGMDDGVAAQIILSAMGFSGSINRHNYFPSVWPALNEIFREKGLALDQSLPTDIALADIQAAAARIGSPQSPNDIQRVLESKKGRQIYETIAISLNQKGAIPGICGKILEALKETWLKQRPLGQYQFDASGNLSTYNT